MSYTTQQFSPENSPLHHLVHEIDSGMLGLPAGYFLFWATPKEADSHSIGAKDPDDGQKNHF